MTQERSQSVTKIRQLFRTSNRALSLADIRSALPELDANKISMTLCYLMRQKYCTRTQIDNPSTKSRRKVWLYEYSDNRFLGVANEN